MMDAQVGLDEATMRDLWPVCEMEYGIYDKQIGVGAPEKHECDQPSKWIVHSRCRCGAREISLLCTPHVDLLSKPDGWYRCPSCGWVGTAALTVADVQELR